MNISINNAISPDLLVEILRIAIPVLIVIAGWIVVNRQNNNRERRKEILSLISELSQIVGKLRDDSIDYYQIPATDKDKARILSEDIKARFTLLSLKLLSIQDAGLTMNCSNELVSFKKSATGGHFDSADRRSQLKIEGWSSDISSSSYDLIRSFERVYFRESRRIKF